MTSLTLSSPGSPLSSPRANSELSFSMTASQNGVWSWRGFLKAQNWGCLLSWSCVSTWLGKYQEEDKEEAVKRTIKESEIFVSQIFYNFFPLIFLSITLLYHLFLYYCNLGHLPTTHDPRPTTHDPRPTPTPTTHDPRHLATLFFLQHNNIFFQKYFRRSRFSRFDCNWRYLHIFRSRAGKLSFLSIGLNQCLGLFTWRVEDKYREDPRKRNNFTLGLHAEISVRVSG